MEYNEIENHDDFYSVDEREFIHVQDQRVINDELFFVKFHYI